jgi:hypothetical protein
MNQRYDLPSSPCRGYGHPSKTAHSCHQTVDNKISLIVNPDSRYGADASTAGCHSSGGPWEQIIVMLEIEAQSAVLEW